MEQEITIQNRFRGLMIGTAVGDSLGLPFEGISSRRIKKLTNARMKHKLIFNRGMLSDDTEHTIFVAQSLLSYPESSKLFARRLSMCLRWWMISLPAGIGWATLRAIFKLWIGFPPSKSGVYSAGNGPAMRSAILGAFFANASKEIMDDYIFASTIITHTDPKAFIGAKAVSYIASWAFRENLTNKPDITSLINVLKDVDNKDNDWINLVNLISNADSKNLSVEEFARSIGLSKGVTGYIYHTIPIAIYAWYRHFGDFEKAITSVIKCGGDTDTVAAITGAISGATVGDKGIPEDWIQNIWDWPRNIKLLDSISYNLSNKGYKVSYFYPGVFIRNIFFLIIVLLHGFRRLFPPY
ncbi:MAG: ADP-ribosylglycohydrolase family protein [Desulfobacterales bacterium]|nr:ADP-ribosylglycohydrolase family protein [Desulfobacterales bacterium]